MKTITSRMFFYDWIGVFYNLFMGGILIFFHKGFPDWINTSLIHVAVIAGIFGVIWLYHQFPNWITRFLRYLYPIMLTGFYYGETQKYIFIIFDGWFDDLLIQAEAAIFGSEITLLVEKISHPWVTEFIIMGYLSYYPLMFIAPLYIYLKAERRLLLTMLFAYVLTFSLSLPQFFLFPVEGPRWHLVDQYMGPVPGAFFVDIAYSIMRCCAVHGGAMPSTHTAISIIIVYCFWHINRKVFWWYSPLFVGLILGTFWGRFHYFSDTVVGALIAFLSLYLARRSERFELADPQPRPLRKLKAVH